MYSNISHIPSTTMSLYTFLLISPLQNESSLRPNPQVSAVLRPLYALRTNILSVYGFDSTRRLFSRRRMPQHTGPPWEL